MSKFIKFGGDSETEQYINCSFIKIITFKPYSYNDTNMPIQWVIKVECEEGYGFEYFDNEEKGKQRFADIMRQCNE